MKQKVKKGLPEDLSKKAISIYIYSKGGFFTSDKIIGQATIKLDQLEVTNKIDDMLEFKYENKKYTLENCILIREPLSKFGKKEIECIKKIKIYPPFNLNENVAEYKPKITSEIVQTKNQENEKIPNQEEKKKS